MNLILACALKHDGLSLDGLNSLVVPDILTERACVLLCLADEDMPCRSVEYFVSGRWAERCSLAVQNLASTNQIIVGRLCPLL